MKIGKVQMFIQNFLRECKRDFDQESSEAGLWDEFLLSLCKDYAEKSENLKLKVYLTLAFDFNPVHFRIPMKTVLEEMKKIRGGKYLFYPLEEENEKKRERTQDRGRKHWDDQDEKNE